MGIWSKKPPKTDDEPYDPARLYDIHEHGMTLNIDQFMKKPGIQEDIAALRDIGRAIRKKQQREALKKQGDSA